MMISALLACVVAVTPGQASWPGFLGPQAANLKAAELPLEWSPTENIAWKTPLAGYGQSSPVVWGDHVYVTTVEGPMKDVCRITAIDLSTGAERWRADLEACSKVAGTTYVSRAAPTPVADQRGIVVFFEGGNLAAFDHDGRDRWQRNLVEEFGPITSNHGLSSSLVQIGDTAFVWVERQEHPYLLAIDTQSGDIRWRSDGAGATAWSSPVLVEVGDASQIVLSASGSLSGIDPTSGKHLWRFDGVSGNTTPTPRPIGGGKLLVGATMGRGETDTGNAAASNGVVQITHGEDGFAAEYQWRCKRATSSFGSPAAHRGLAYFVNSTGVLYCVDLKTGDEVYAQRLADSTWATPLTVDDRIYFFGKGGVTTVLAAGREFKKLAENRLWSEEEAETQAAAQAAASHGTSSGEAGGPPPMSTGPVLYAAAAVDQSLLLRTGDTLYCIRNDAGTSTANVGE